MSLTPTIIFANSASYTLSHSLPQKINSYFLKASYTFNNKITGASTIIAKQLSKPQVAKLLTYVISRRFAAFAALGTIAAEAGMSTIDVDGKTLIVQKLPETDIVNVLTTGNNEYVPVSGNVLSLNYCVAALAQLNHLYPAMRYIPANSANWCELVNFSSNYKELSLTLSTAEDPVSTTKVTVAPTQVDKQVIPQPIQNYAVVSPEVLGETVFNKAKPADLAPLFDYNEVYQSPAAIEAINEYNNTKGEAFPLHPDITTPALDQPVTTKPSDINVEFPIFCTWAGTICESVTFIQDKVGEISDFFRAEPQQDTQLDFPVDTPVNINTDIKFNGQCPAPLTYDFNYGGHAQSFGIKDFTPFCSMLNDILKPIVIAVSSFVAVLIIGGVRTDE